MSSGKVQIGGGNDPHARYIRPRMIIKVEGAGNGIKTVLSNLEDIAHDLHVDPEYPCKFFGMALGVQSRSEKQKVQKSASGKTAKAITRYIINGQHQLPQLETLLTEFEKLFVCCPKCTAAEIRLSVTKKEVVQYDCAGCGQHSDLPTKHKFVSFIAKHPPSDNVKATVVTTKPERLMDGASSKEDDGAAGDDAKSGDAASSKPKKSGSKKAAAAAEPEVVWATDTSAEAQRKRMEEEMAAMTVKGADAVMNKSAKPDAAAPAAAAAAAAAAEVDVKESNPFEAATKLFAAYLTAPAAAAAPAADDAKSAKKKASPFVHSADENVAELRRLCLVRGLDDGQRFGVAWNALLQPTATAKDEKALIAAFPAALQTHAPTFRKLAASNKNLFFQSYESLISEKPKLLGYVPHCIKAMYDADVLDEPAILSWHATPKAGNKAIRDKATPFVEWLKAAEEDDD